MDMATRGTGWSIVLAIMLATCSRHRETAAPPPQDDAAAAPDVQAEAATAAPVEPEVPSHILWVGTGCPEDSDCSGRKVTARSGDLAVTVVTGPSGVARFVLKRPPRGAVHLEWSEPNLPAGKEIKPADVLLGQGGELLAAFLHITGVEPVQVEKATSVESFPVTSTSVKAGKVESMRSIKGLPSAPFSGSSKGKGSRDVVVFTSYPGSYLYVEGKRYGEVGPSGFAIEKVPVGTHRFVAKMPPNAPEYLPPATEVREVVKGNGAQVVRLSFARTDDPMAAMLKKVEEGGSLTASELDSLSRIRPDDPRYGDSASVLVTFYEKKKRYPEALQVLATMAGTSRYAGDPEVHFHLAKLKTATGDLDGALQSLVDMERYMNQYRAGERNRKMAELYRLRAKVNGLLFARSRGTKPGYLEASNRDWKSFMGLTTSESEKQKALEEIRKNEQRLTRTGE